MDVAEARHTLLELLAKHAYQYKVGGFKLVSGVVSDEYLDCKQALSRSAALPALGTLVLSILKPEVIAVGGLTMGADPIAASTALVSAGTSRPVRWFSVRKDRKQHGQRRLVEGAVCLGDRIAVLDDVATTGGSTIEAIEKCRAEGLDVVQVIVLVDRQQDGLRRIREAAGSDVLVQSLFEKSEIRAAWEAGQVT